MLVGVISDTHDNLDASRKFNGLFHDRGVEKLIHLGDFIAPFTFKSVFNGFEGNGYSVFGNNDGEKAVLLRTAGEMRVVLKDHPYSIEFNDRKLLVLHGFGSPENTLDIVRSLLYSSRYDVVLYGHTHVRNLERTSSGLLLNPGEASGVLYSDKTAVILDLDKLEVEWLQLP